MDEWNWEGVICYTKARIPAPGVFWEPHNKIYIQCSAKGYPLYYEHLKEHEKKHYRNNNEKKHRLFKIYNDIKIELYDSLKLEFHKEIRRERELYWRIWEKEKPSRKNWNVKKLNKIQRLHSGIVKYWRFWVLSSFTIIFGSILLGIICLMYARA